MGVLHFQCCSHLILNSRVTLYRIQLMKKASFLTQPLFLLGISFVQKKYKFSIASTFSSIIVGFTGTISTYWFPLPNGSNPDSQLLLIKLLPGFWLWLAAPAFVMIIASGFAYWKHSHRLERKSVKFR